MIAFNLACYASVAGRMEEAKERLFHAIELDKEARKLALEDEDLNPPLGLDWRFEIVGRAFQAPVCSLFTRKSSTWSRFSKRRDSPEQSSVS